MYEPSEFLDTLFPSLSFTVTVTVVPSTGDVSTIISLFVQSLSSSVSVVDGVIGVLFSSFSFTVIVVANNSFVFIVTSADSLYSLLSSNLANVFPSCHTHLFCSSLNIPYSIFAIPLSKSVWLFVNVIFPVVLVTVGAVVVGIVLSI